MMRYYSIVITSPNYKGTKYSSYNYKKLCNNYPLVSYNECNRLFHAL